MYAADRKNTPLNSTRTWNSKLNFRDACSWLATAETDIIWVKKISP